MLLYPHTKKTERNDEHGNPQQIHPAPLLGITHLHGGRRTLHRCPGGSAYDLGVYVMKGADKYTAVFKEAVQIGCLYILPHYHARGDTFRIYVLPEGVEVIENGGTNPPLNDNFVEVYGVISGQLGWTEEYGWLHTGKWIDDFEKIYMDKVAAREKLIAENKNTDSVIAERKKTRENSILSEYI